MNDINEKIEIKNTMYIKELGGTVYLEFYYGYPDYSSYANRDETEYAVVHEGKLWVRPLDS